MTDRRSSPPPSSGILTVVLVYAAFAALWILLSDKAVALRFQDPAMITRVSTIKGWVFVAVTSALLFGLMRRLTGVANAPEVSSRSMRRMILPAGLLAVAIVALSASAIIERFRLCRETEGARLGVIADLKTRQIADWLDERESDARYLATGRHFAGHYRRWRGDGTAAVPEGEIAQLEEFRKANGFQGVAVLDERGDLLWSSYGSTGPDQDLQAVVQESVAAGEVRRLGPRRDSTGRLHLDFVAPLRLAGDPPPVVVLHADPEVFLYRVLREWPAPSASAETLLFRRDGDQLLFLSQSRHLHDTALRLRAPSPGSDTARGVQYRGVPVIGAIRAVPGTDWLLAAQTDEREVYAEAAADALWVGLAGLLALCGALAGLFLFSQRRQLATSLHEQRIQAERLQALRLLEAMSESSGDAIFAKDLAGRYLLFNREAARITGKRPEDVLGRDDRAIFAPEEAELAMSIGRRVIAEDRTVTSEEVVTTSEGTLVFLATKGPLHDDTGRVIGIFGISRDITARKRAEEALRENEALTRAVLDNLPLGVAVNSVDPTVPLYMNDNFPRLYRTTREKLSDPDAFWSAAYEDQAFREEIKKRVLEDCASGDPERMYWVDVPITRAGAETTYITARNTPVPGKPLVISTVWDVTERKRAEEEKVRLETQLLQAQKMESIGRLAGGVAHDFNNLLFVIMGHVALALERVDPAQPVHADLEEIRKAAQRSADLTRQLLAFARRQTVTPQVLDLNRSVPGLLSMLRRLIGEDIDLIWRPGQALWPVWIDPAQLDQILANLCVNARDAIAGVGTISIETANVAFDEAYCADHPGFLPGEYVLLAVSDDGCGMTAEVLAHAFEPFFTTKEVGRGTGLGLSTVYGIVKQNAGFVNVYSEPGEGTTLKIYLPRCKGGVVEEPSGPPAEMPLGRGETVLMVEDEASVLNLGEAMLERLGYAVLTAGTAAAAIGLAEAHAGAIDLLVTDVVMPGMNGRELAARLGAGNPQMKCLFMSGYTADVIAHRGVLEKHLRFIQKPFSIKDLARKVREALDAEGTVAAATGGAPELRVLYVDDEESLLELVRRDLGRRGHRVVGYADPAAALAEFRRRPGEFDYVVTDLAMPGMSGFELVRRLSAVRSDVPIAIVSGCVTAGDEAEARALGVSAVIVKPGTVEELGTALDRLFRAGA